MNRRKLGAILSLVLLSAVAIVMLIVFTKEEPGEPGVALARTPRPTLLPPTSAPQPAAQLPATIVSPAIAYPTLPPNHSLNANQVADRELNYLLDHYFFEEPGTVIAQGNNATPVPSTRGLMYTYQVAEIELPRTITRTHLVPISGTLQPRLQSYNKVWRLTITGGPFHFDNSTYKIYLNDTPVGYAIEDRRGIKGMKTFIFDATLLQEGARIGVSSDHSRPIYLPETLHFTQQPSP